MKFQKLGNSDLEISAIGFGGNALTDFFGPVDDKESLETLNKALDVGITFIDSSDSYGKGSNEELLSGLLAERRDDMVLCTKFGNFVVELLRYSLAVRFLGFSIASFAILKTRRNVVSVNQ